MKKEKKKILLQLLAFIFVMILLDIAVVRIFNTDSANYSFLLPILNTGLLYGFWFMNRKVIREINNSEKQEIERSAKT